MPNGFATFVVYNIPTICNSEFNSFTFVFIQHLLTQPLRALVELSQLLPPLGSDGKTQPLTAEQLRLLFNQKLEHFIQETEVYKAESQLLKDQLMLERNGRVQAEVRLRIQIQISRVTLRLKGSEKLIIKQNN